MKVWKRKICLVLTMCLLLSVFAFGTVVSADELPPVTVTVNGEQIIFDVQPVFEGDRVLVPVRFIFEALGAEITWDDTLQKVTAVRGEDTIEIVIDQMVMLKNGQEIILDVPARLIGDRTLVPVRAVAEGMDADVKWIDELQQVVITTEEISATQTPKPSATTSPAPTATAAPTAAVTEKPEKTGKSYAYDELAPEDMRALKNSYNNKIRCAFEQDALPLAVLKDNDEIVKAIRTKSKDAKTSAQAVWNLLVVQRILEIQMNSENNYEVSADEALVESYLALVKEAGLEANDYFDVSFETLKDRSVMMLLTFKEIDTLMACKYIGVVVQPDDTVRYFTAETDLWDKENLYFCEITTKGRGTIGVMGFEKDDFIASVEAVL